MGNKNNKEKTNTNEHQRQEALKKYDMSIVTDHFIAMEYPHGSEHIKTMRDVFNVKLIFNLTNTDYDFEIKKGYEEEFIPKVIKLSVTDGCIPTLDQVNEFIKEANETITNGGVVLVHCLMGLGRTGTMIASFLVKEGGMTPDKAIKLVREKRKGSIVNEDQETFIKSLTK